MAQEALDASALARLKLRAPHREPMAPIDCGLGPGHLAVLRRKLDILAKVEALVGLEWLRDVLANKSLECDEAVTEAVEHLERRGVSSAELLALVEFRLVELHPCDVCNLRCRGCAFQHDLDDVERLSNCGSAVLKDYGTSGAQHFPLHRVGVITELLKPRAVILSGGGEPGLYSCGTFRLGDFASRLHGLDSAVKIGLITNLTVSGNAEAKPQQKSAGVARWQSHVQWVRASIDAGSEEVYLRIKRRPLFHVALENVMRLLQEGQVPVVGIGFGFAEDNALDIVALLELIDRDIPHDLRGRLRVQLRPWKDRDSLSTSRPVISEGVLRRLDVRLNGLLDSSRDRDALEDFLLQNTNILDLLSRGASQCFKFGACCSGLVKCLVRADGSMWPCCVMRGQEFCLGNILRDSPVGIALRILRVFAVQVPAHCLPIREQCLRNKLNASFERALEGSSRGAAVDSWLTGAFF